MPGRPQLTIAERSLLRLDEEESSARPDMRVAARAATDKGILSTAELHACGLTSQAIWGRARKGFLHRVHQGVWAVGHANLSVESCFMAAVKACRPRVALSHYAAAAHRGYVKWDFRPVEVLVPSDRRCIRPGLRIHRTAHWDETDLARVDGIPVTSPARTLLDLASVVDSQKLRRAMNQALALGDVTAGELAEVLLRLGPRRGSRNFAQLLAVGPEPTRSELEDVVLALILSGGFVKPDVNKPLWLSGRKVIPDFRWPEQHVVVEADSSAWHDNKLAREDDAERQAFLEAHRERVVRVTWNQAVLSPAETLERIANASAPQVRAER